MSARRREPAPTAQGRDARRQNLHSGAERGGSRLLPAKCPDYEVPPEEGLRVDESDGDVYDWLKGRER
jgi:hypothetical protein